MDTERSARQVQEEGKAEKRRKKVMRVRKAGMQKALNFVTV